MPCYDSRDNEPQPFDHHNNPTAELLCDLMTALDQHGLLGNTVMPIKGKLWHWWENHKARDAKKADMERRAKAQREVTRKENIRQLERQLAQLKKG